MEGLGDLGFSGARKRRSATLRRPRPESQLVSESCDISTQPSAPSLNNPRKLSPDDDGGSESSIRRKEIYLNNPPPKSSSLNIYSSKKIKKGDKISGVVDGGYYGVGSSRGGNGSDLKRCSEGVLTQGQWRSTYEVEEDEEQRSISPGTNPGNSESYGAGVSSATAENKPRKVKLKVGGVTRAVLETDDGGSSSAKPPRSQDPSRQRLKIIARDYTDGHSLAERGNGSKGDQRKQPNGSSFIQRSKDDSSGTMFETSSVGKQADKFHGLTSSEPTRKSKRVPKKRVFDDDEEDDEIRYLEKLKTAKVSADDSAELEENSESSVKKKKLSNLPKSKNVSYEMDDDYASSRATKESRKKLKTGKESDDTDYVEEEELGSDGGEPDIKRKKQKETIGSVSPADVRTEPLTTRQRALQSGKGGNGESFIEFPNGLPPAPSRKQKKKLSEVEIQAKKAEAAQRRKMQVEKKARESEAEAIRKILGHDSDKKKEEKKQKELEEKAKSAKSQELSPSTIRWVNGPLGTVVIFAEDVGLPSIFNSKPCSYPPPREKCAGPECTNAYKYRDSKSKLPLCSLRCYKAVQGVAGPSITC